MDRILYAHRWMTLRENHQGEAFVEMEADAVMIVALTDHKEVLLIQEKSIATGRETLSLPTGGVTPGEHPAVTARRELQEEVGFLPGEVQFLGTLNPSTKYLRWQCHLYLATDLQRSWLPGDEASPVRTVTIPLNVVDHLIDSGTLTDATAIAALWLARRYMEDRDYQSARLNLLVTNR